MTPRGMAPRRRTARSSWLLASILLALFLLNAPGIDAQPRSSSFGTHFIVVFPDTARHYAPPASVQLFDSKCFVVIMSLDTATVVIEGGGIDQTLTVYPSSSVTIDVPPRFLNVVETPTEALLDIRSDRDISLHCYYMTPYGSEAFTPLPVSSWENEYYVMSYRQETLRQINFVYLEERPTDTLAPGQIVIVASEPTSIMITYPPAMRSTSPKTFTLGGGEAMLLESNGRPGEKADLSGTHIAASKPIGVISGHTRTLGGDHYGQYYNGVRPMVNSPMQNAAVEWIHPMRDHGSIFVYRPINPIQEENCFELIRVYATSPGITVVRSSHTDTASMLHQGEYTSYLSNWVGKGSNDPITLTADRPAQAMVISGVYAEPVDPTQLAYATYNVWAGAMVELTPHERWISYGRFSPPDYPVGLQNYVTIVADPWATVWLDSNEVLFDPEPAPQGYRQTRVKVTPGDHSITSRNGAFSAVVFGQAKGFTEYKPPKAKREERRAQELHPSVYGERMSVAYAFPLSGPPAAARRDSMMIATEPGCDSMLITAHRAPGTYGPPLRAPSIAPESHNVKIESWEIVDYGSVTGYRILVKPDDAALAASGVVVIADVTGKQWTVPFSYRPPRLSFTPAFVRIVNEPAGAMRSVTVTIGNESGGAVTISALTLKHGANGFKVPSTISLPAHLDADGTLAVRLDFTGGQPGISYYDTLVVETACGLSLVPLHASTRPIIREPMPDLGGYDWKERWVTTLSACTKSGIAGYVDSIAVMNNGSAPFFISSFELLGADADNGYFSFGPLSLKPGDSVGAGAIIRQRVLFRPKDERPYACKVRLITTYGDTLLADLLGSGIESHVAIGDYDFGTIELRPGARVAGSVTLLARGTRPLVVRELRVGGDASFSIDPGFTAPRESDPSSWWSMLPDEERVIPLLFTPESAGERRGSIEVIGDHARCDDSTGDLAGRSYASSIVTEDLDFGPVLLCDDAPGAIELRNNGDGVVDLLSFELVDPWNVFHLEPPLLPMRLEAGASLRLPLRFAPHAAGRADGHVLFVVRHNGSGTIDSLFARLTGVGGSIAAGAHIDRSYRGAPGQRITTPIVLDASLDDARVEEIIIRLPRRTHVSLVQSDGDLRAMLAGTIIADWTIGIDPSSSGDTLVLRLHAPLGKWLQGTGDLLRPEIGTFLRDSLGGELPFGVELVDRVCASIDAHPGRVMLDSICGLNLRLIELSRSSYALEGNRPNPFNPVTEIEFTLGLDGSTLLVVYDGAGREVARLVDGYLGPGRYRVQWDARGHASGAYRYRIRSGAWSATGEMILRK